MPVSAEEIRLAFRAGLKTLSCPHCEIGYSDYAVDWSEAWLHGRRDAMHDLGKEERDGPVKLKCELCDGFALTDAFLSPPRKA